MDEIAAAVAVAVGLAEGEAGVRDVLRAIAGTEPVPTRELSRLAELPVPIVTAICNELRKRSVVDRTRPVRLTERARAALAAVPRLAVACDCCGGIGVSIPTEIEALRAELGDVMAGAPAARMELDQSHCTVDTKIHRVLRLYAAGALDGRRIVLLGDDDMIAVAIARFARLTGTTAGIRRLTVIDTDPAVLAWTGDQIAGTGVPVELVEHDLRLPVPDRLASGFDVACTDPPYTVAGAKLFLSRAVTLLHPVPGQHIFFSFGARRPAETLATQCLIADLGLAVRSLTPNFNSYLGAGILAGTSHLYHLRSTETTAPLLNGGYDGPLYTADSRTEQNRPYRCAGCGTVHLIGRAEADGEPPRWAQIGDLQAAGCPDCGGVRFRPMSRTSR